MGQKYIAEDTVLTPVSSRPDLYEEGSIDPIYRAKAHLLSNAIQEIGMGKYQVMNHPVDCYVRMITNRK